MYFFVGNSWSKNLNRALKVIINFIGINKNRVNCSKRAIHWLVVCGYLLLVLCVWGHIGQCYPGVLKKWKWFLSACLDSCSDSPFFLASISPSFHTEVWMVAHFLKSDIEHQAFLAFSEIHLPGHLSARGRGMLWPMWLWRVIYREGLSARYFMHVL